MAPATQGRGASQAEGHRCAFLPFRDRWEPETLGSLVPSFRGARVAFIMSHPLHNPPGDAFSSATSVPQPQGEGSLPFEPAVQEAIQRLVRRLTRTGFIRRDAEDLRQELILAWLQRRAGYDPSKGSLGAYARTVLSRAAVDLRRRRQAACRDPHRLLSLEGEDLLDPNVSLERLEAVLDAEHLLASLPAEEVQLLLAWARNDLVQLADQRRVHPTALRQQARKLLSEIQSRLSSPGGATA